MKIIIAADYEDMSKKAAALLAAQVTLKPDCVLGLATGSTPIWLYKELIRLCKAGELDFSAVKSVNLDEYVGLDGAHDQSYRYFMKTTLFDGINIDQRNCRVPCGVADDLDKECAEYDENIVKLGGIDMQLLGIGNNGHIAFNEPCEEFVGPTHKVKLTENTIKANSRLFSDISEVPTHALTMGCRAIMGARKIVLVASGEGKAEIMREACFGPVTPHVPASILQLHPDVTVVADAAAGRLLK